MPRCPIKPHDLAPPKVNLVQVGGEQLLLADRSVESARVPDLRSLAFKLAEHVPLIEIVEDQVLKQLHRYRAAAPTETPAENRRERDEVHAAVFHKAPIFHSDDGLFHGLRDLVWLEDHR